MEEETEMAVCVTRSGRDWREIEHKDYGPVCVRNEKYKNVGRIMGVKTLGKNRRNNLESRQYYAKGIVYPGKYRKKNCRK